MRPRKNLLRGRSHWVLEGEARKFYVCASVEPHERRVALCVFDGEEEARRHLASLGEARMFLDTLERYGKNLPAWMRDEPFSPGPREVSADELAGILAETGISYVTLNPPSGETRTLELVPSRHFLVSQGPGK